MKKIWTSEEVAFLKANYANMKTKELLSVLTNKTNDQLRWKAKEFGLHKQVTRSKADMTWLEDFDNAETCYWWGFITADGCINHRQLILSIHERDKSHLQRFCDKAQSNLKLVTRKEHPWHPGPYTMARTVLEDKFALERLKIAIKIQPRKTYNPLDISVFCQPHRLAAFMAGLIDGDGYIQVNEEKSIAKISIKVHPNWTESFKILAEKLGSLYGIEAIVNFTKEGWVYISIYKMRHVIRLYDLINNKVPLMDRKWKLLDPIREHCLASTDRRIKKIGVNPSANLGERSLKENLAVAELLS